MRRGWSEGSIGGDDGKEGSGRENELMNLDALEIGSGCIRPN